jgi:polyphenol oxidase
MRFAVPSQSMPDVLLPDWDADGVGALMTTRIGGVSAPPFDSFNLRAQIGDAEDAVAANQAQLARIVGAVPVYLNQVHGARVVRLGRADVQPGAPVHDADASVTTLPGVACAVQVADCLPVLFAAPGGRAVGAAHAGWRGLAGGVLEATLDEVCAAAACDASQVQAWLGACIGPTRFEVGADVLARFGHAPGPGVTATPAARDTTPHFVPHAPGKWLADLAGLAQDRLRAAGVRSLHGGHWCTVTDASRFFSFRRDHVTGRMAALIWIGSGRSG